MAIFSLSRGYYRDYITEPKDPNQLYFCIDTQQLFVGAQEYTASVRQFTTMPDSWEVGKIVEYVGSSDGTYTQGYFYLMTEDGWVQISTQPDTRPIPITYAEYQALPDEERLSHVYVITDFPEQMVDASDVTYDDTTVYNKLVTISNNQLWKHF